MGWSSALCLGATALQAQTTNQWEQMQQSLRELQRVVQEQQAQIERLMRELETMKTPTPPEQPAIVPPSPDADDLAELRAQVDRLTEAGKAKPPSIFNPAIGFVGETLFSYNSRANYATGFERPGGWDAFLRSAELNIEASVDPFVRGYAVLNASADAATGEASVGVEEAAVVTRSLPWNLTLQAGRFFGEFGRLSSFHDHDLPFVLRPIVLMDFVYGESQTDGLQVNWLLPTRHYISLTGGMGLKFGALQADPGTFRYPGNLNYWGRLSSSFDFSRKVSLEVGTSGLWAPSQNLYLYDGMVDQRERQLVGVDLTLRYHPPGASLHQGLEWGTEYLLAGGDYTFDPDANPGSGDEFSKWNQSSGLYTYLTWKFSRDWSAGFLFDWSQSVDNSAAAAFRYSPYVTWRPSEFQMLRLQYSYTAPNAATGFLDDHGVYLQWVWIIGSHAHGFRHR